MMVGLCNQFDRWHSSVSLRWKTVTLGWCVIRCIFIRWVLMRHLVWRVYAVIFQCHSWTTLLNIMATLRHKFGTIVFLKYSRWNILYVWHQFIYDFLVAITSRHDIWIIWRGGYRWTTVPCSEWWLISNIRWKLSLLFALHSSVLKPDLDLPLWQR